jgi:hypothetical protein
MPKGLPRLIKRCLLGALGIANGTHTFVENEAVVGRVN